MKISLYGDLVRLHYTTDLPAKYVDLAHILRTLGVIT